MNTSTTYTECKNMRLEDLIDYYDELVEETEKSKPKER